MLEHLRFCLVTDIKTSVEEYTPFLLQAIDGGLKSVQLRAKGQEPDTVYAMAVQLKKLLTPYDIPLIINDHVEIAREVDAAGVHIGQADEAPYRARALLGKDKLIGLSIESQAELVAANALPCINYVAASAVFATASKTNLKKIWGLDGLRELCTTSIHPVLAIGGINLSIIDAVLAQGAYGIAVISALHDAHNPQEMASLLAEKITQGIRYE